MSDPINPFAELSAENPLTQLTQVASHEMDDLWERPEEPGDLSEFNEDQHDGPDEPIDNREPANDLMTAEREMDGDFREAEDGWLESVYEERTDIGD